MAAGEYVSVRTQREMYEYQIALEREEVEKYPDEEAEELALIYEARGVNIRLVSSAPIILPSSSIVKFPPISGRLFNNGLLCMPLVSALPPSAAHTASKSLWQRAKSGLSRPEARK